MPHKLNFQVSLKQIILKRSNHYNPQDLNSKSQQSQQFIQTSITSQRENATITKNILTYSYQQAVNWRPSILEVHNNNQNTSQEYIQQKQIESNDLSYQITSFFQEILGLLLKILKQFEKILLQYNDKNKLQNIIHQALLLVEQLQKLPIEIHKIFQRLLIMTGQSQKQLVQHPKTEDDPNFSKAQFQQSLEIIQEKTEKTEQEIKDILQRLNKQVTQNMQEQPHDILEQISKILKHHLISLQCQNYQELPKQPQLDIQFEDEFDFNQFELEVQKRAIKNDRIQSKQSNK
ncbi:hypothetical protein ABPG72_020377 [Tetrahymena utriculariae]